MLKIGFGYDVHPLVKDRKLILGGIEFKHPENKGLDGHSDGDVYYHAIIDALLGIAGMDSIGELFPETQEYKDIDSAILLERTIKLLKERFEINFNNIDSTIVSKTARISKVKDEIKENLSNILKIDKKYINIKGKSGNTLGIGGKDEGIEVYTTILADINEK